MDILKLAQETYTHVMEKQECQVACWQGHKPSTEAQVEVCPREVVRNPYFVLESPWLLEYFMGCSKTSTHSEIIFHFNCRHGKHKWRRWIGNIRGVMDGGGVIFGCRGPQANMFSHETLSLCFLIHSLCYRRQGVILINAPS